MEGIQDVEDHMAEEESPKKCRIIESSILESFSKLDSDVEKYRISAGVTLLQQLVNKQHENENDSMCRELYYTVNRLIRGMVSLKPFKRSGYFSALVCILTSITNVTIQDVLKSITKELCAENNSKGEKSESLRGQILAYGTIIRSNLYAKGTATEQREIISKLITLESKKNVYSLLASSFLVDLIYKSGKSNFKEIICPLLKPFLCKPWKEQSLSTLYLLLAITRQYPKIARKQFLIENLKVSYLGQKECLSPICDLLMDAPETLNVLHPVYDEICCEIASQNNSSEFWKLVVNSVQSRSNQSKELAMMDILLMLLSHVSDKNQIPNFLCSDFVEILIKTFQMKKTKIALAEKCRNILLNMIKSLMDKEVEDETRMTFIRILLFQSGKLTFELLSGTKFVIPLSEHMQVNYIKELISEYSGIITNTKHKVTNTQVVSYTTMDRCHAVQRFTRLLVLRKVQEDLEWKIEQVKFLASFTLLNTTHKPGDNIPKPLTDEVKASFYKALDHHYPSIDQLSTMLSSIVEFVHNIAFSTKNTTTLREPFTESALAAWHKMIEVTNKMKETAGVHHKETIESASRVLHVLFLYMGLQLFYDATLAEEVLQDLHCCLERISDKKKRKSLKEQSISKQTEKEEPHWINVIVDLFLSLLSQDSHQVRSMVGTIFPYLCPHLTPSAFQQIIQVLDPIGKNPLTNSENPEDDVDEMDTEDSDASLTDGEDGNDEEEKEEEEEEDDDEDIEEPSGDQVNDQVRMAVQKALLETGGSDAESVDMDDMTEEEGKRLDAALSNAFKLLKHNNATNKKSKKQSKDDATLMHFRIRVMDLLEIYFRHKPAVDLTLNLIMPLFKLLEYCIGNEHQKPLENRIRNCMKQLLGTKQFSNTHAMDFQTVGDVLKHILEKGECVAAVYQNMGTPLTQCCTFLVRLSSSIEKQNSSIDGSIIENIYIEALQSFFRKRDSLLPFELFKSVLSLQWEGSWKLISIILDLAFDQQIRPFRRIQALQLLATFYKCLPRHFNNMSSAHNEILTNQSKSLSHYTIELLKEATRSETNATFKEKYLRELFLLLCTVHTVHRKYPNCVSNFKVDWNSVKDAVIQFLEIHACKQSPEVRKIANFLNIRLQKRNVKGRNSSESKEVDENGDPVAKSKISDDSMTIDNSEDENGEDIEDNHEESINEDVDNDANEEDPEKTSKKKKKKEKRKKRDKMAQKKQSDLLRCTAMADGLDNSFSFSNFPRPVVQNEAMDDSNVNDLCSETNLDNASDIKRKKKKGFHGNQGEHKVKHAKGDKKVEEKINFKEIDTNVNEIGSIHSETPKKLQGKRKFNGSKSGEENINNEIKKKKKKSVTL